MAALLYNLVRTTLGAPLLTAGTAITFDTPLQEGGVNVPTLSGDYIWLKINDELMHLTAYTAGTLTGTVLRAQGNTIAADHNLGDAVGAVATKAEFSSGGGGLPIRIAAVDSPAEDIAASTYLCDGTDDDIIFQAAYNSLDNTYGGTIAVSPGTYHFEATVTLGNAPVHFQGDPVIGRALQSQPVKILRDLNAANFPLFTISATTVQVSMSDMWLEDDGSFTNTSPIILLNASSTRLRLIRCQVNNWQPTPGTAIKMTTTTANGAELTLIETKVGADNYCIDGASIQTTILGRDCSFYGGVSAVNLTSLSANSYIKFYNCVVTGGGKGWYIQSAASPPPVVKIVDCETISGVDGPSVELDGATSVGITGLRVKTSVTNAIKLTACTAGVVANCELNDIDDHGIWLVDCEDMSVEGNALKEYGISVDDTYSGIFIAGDSLRCSVIGNTLRSRDTASLATKALHGIRVDASTCIDTYIANNDLRASCKTTGNEVKDLGTTTYGHEVLTVAASDETTALTTGTAKVTFRMPFAMCLTKVRASLNTASSSGDPAFDINDSGTTILHATDKLEIDSGEKTSTTATTPTSIVDSALADDAEITVDIDTAGTGAKGAKISLYGWRV